MIVVHQDGILRYVNPTGVAWLGADDTGELVGVVCCTKGIGQKTDMWGGSATVAARLRPSPKEAERPGCQHVPAVGFGTRANPLQEAVAN